MEKGPRHIRGSDDNRTDKRGDKKGSPGSPGQASRRHGISAHFTKEEKLEDNSPIVASQHPLNKSPQTSPTHAVWQAFVVVLLVVLAFPRYFFAFAPADRKSQVWDVSVFVCVS